MAIIDFEPDGAIVKGNKTFCYLMGYPAKKIIGKKHRMFLVRD
ncbi:PAS domain S-box-containing protein [Pseudorhizobium tarimense]|uniref:PAS domain S-box-containing protein n=1 Tax=Pseudorhizobium tarimense TaxID=1079109 RepID=A0ABV2H0A4_9HYPH